MPQHTLAYGLWPSPVTPSSLSVQRRLQDLCWDTDGETLVWLEGRSGHGMLVCSAAGGQAPRDLTPEHSVRARVGYGGGDFAVAQGQVYFVSDGRLYRRSLNSGRPKAVTPAFGDVASPRVSPDGRWIVFVHSYEGADCLGVVDAEGNLWPQRLLCGDDFYMQPVWHPTGRHIAWVSWNHPQMPWDGTRLGLATLADSGTGMPSISEKRVIAGDENTAIFQPEFSPDGRCLSYISDANGWDNLYLYEMDTGAHRPLLLAEADLGAPAWRQGMRTYAWSPDGTTIYYNRNDRGFVTLQSLNVETGQTAPVQALTNYCEISRVSVSSRGQVAAIASGWGIPARVAAFSPGVETIRIEARSEGELLPPEAHSEPEPIAWDSEEGDQVHGLLYMPRSECYVSSGKPPLVVMVHGGPTGQTMAGYALGVQFFTTRGYAVLQVNYRGSTGYGRVYRNKLREQWGIYDVDDAVSGARYLAGQNLVDPEKMVIMGGSAGGYAVLQALIRYPGTFKAGLCLFGVTNLFTLAADTHKFEQRYLDSMIGPLPETAHRYRERSPIFHAERIVDPVAIFQGEEDRVVPMEQAETIVEALRRNGVPHEYHLYPGEGHGWRNSETIKSFYESVLKFLKQYVLFA